MYFNPDEAVQQASDFVDNEVDRVRKELARTSSRPSRTHCIDCDKPIPVERLQIIKGCQRCVSCQETHVGDIIPRTKMLNKML